MKSGMGGGGFCQYWQKKDVAAVVGLPRLTSQPQLDSIYSVLAKQAPTHIYRVHRLTKNNIYIFVQ